MSSHSISTWSHPLLLRVLGGLAVGASVSLGVHLAHDAGAPAVGVPAAAAPSSPPLRIQKLAAVDMAFVVGKSKAGIEALKPIETAYAQMQGDLERARAELQQFVAGLQAKAPSMSPQELQQANQAIEQRQIAIQQQMQQAEGRIQAMVAEVRQKVTADSVRIVEGLAKERGYDLVLVKGSELLAHTKDALDITNEVLELLNKQ